MNLRRTAWALTLALTTVAAAPAAAQQDPATQELITRAQERMAERDYEGAIELFGRAINLSPDSALAWYLRGRARHKSEDLAGAEQDYTGALEREPAYAQALHNRGVARAALGRADEALADFGALIALRPARPDGYLLRANVLLTAGKVAEAIADCTTAIEKAPGAHQAFYMRGAARLRAGDAAEAQGDLRQAVTLAPRAAAYQFHLANISRQADDLAAARAAFDEAIRLSTPAADGRAPGAPLRPLDLARAYSSRGQVRWLQGEKAAALADLQQAVAREPTFPYFALWLAALGGDERPLAQVPDGDEFAHAVVRHYRGELDETLLLAHARQADDDPQRAGQVCQAHCYLGLRAERAGRAADARRHYEAAAATDAALFVEHHWARTRLAALGAARGGR